MPLAFHMTDESEMRSVMRASDFALAPLEDEDARNELVDECVQLHGGYGFMREYPIAKMWTDSRVQRIYGGTNEIMKLLIARTL